MHRHAGHFAYLLIGKGIKRRAGNGHIVPFDNGKFVDFHLQLLAGAAHQDPLLLQRANERQNAADIVDGGPPHLRGAFHHNLRADTVAGKELLHQGAIFLIADKMAAPHAAAAGFYRPAQKAHGAGMVITARLQLLDAPLGVVGEQFGNDIVVFANYTLRRAKADNLLRFQLDSQLRRHLFGGEIKTFAGDRDRHRAEEDDGAAIQLAVNRLIIDTADAPAVAIVHAIIHAQGLGNDKIAAYHIDVRALQRRIIQTHRQPGGDIQL